ncbi:hypothetical protein SEVIR_5G298300v4 [Setaria viridis]|uniref:Uncharacterized protein n=1 Tax=Setaria viridis TaxID=4556 RepID=A0A4V6D732_SETVI|nr:hypothetical protein SEVIR_5G298300v2 [Setaria viridis]
MCFCPFRLDVIFSREKENSPDLPATRHHSCKADKPKARIKKLIAEEATERSVGTCTAASDLSCLVIYGKKAGMSAPVKLALSHGIFASNSTSAVRLLLCQRPPVYCPLFTLSSPDGSLSKKLRLVGSGELIFQSTPRLCFYLYHGSCYLVCMDQTKVFT